MLVTDLTFDVAAIAQLYRDRGDAENTFEVGCLIPASLQRQVHVQQTLVCPCGKTIVTAPGPTRVFPKARYGCAFIAHLIVTKCADAIGINRLAERFRRQGVPMSRNTLVDLFQRASKRLRPLAHLLLQEIAKSDVVQSDATTLRVQAKGKTLRGLHVPRTPKVL